MHRHTNEILKGDECSEVAGASKLARTTLHYNGDVYLLPTK